MAITFGFFNSKNGDRKYTAAQVGDYLQGLVTSGVFADDTSSLQVLPVGGMTVAVQPGRALLNFKFMKNDAPLELTLAAGGAQDRVDAIVAYMDLTERACGITVKQGTPAAAPVAPAMARGVTRNEYMLAAVRVKKLSSTIAAVNITDKRGDENVCGWVTGIIDQVPTGVLLAQYQAACAAELAAMQEYVAQQKQEFDAFFADMTGQLSLSGFMQEYINPVTLTADTRTVQVGITDYVPQEDILHVNVGGELWPNSRCTVTGTGKTAAVTFNTTLKKGELVEFRIIKFKLGTVTMNGEEKLLAVDDTGVILTDGDIALKTE